MCFFQYVNDYDLALKTIDSLKRNRTFQTFLEDHKKAPHYAGLDIMSCEHCKCCCFQIASVRIEGSGDIFHLSLPLAHSSCISPTSVFPFKFSSCYDTL